MRVRGAGCRLLAAALGLVIAGCGSATSASPGPTRQVASTLALHADVASSDLGIGLNRFTFGLLDNNHPIQGGTARVTFYSLQGRSAVPVDSATARFNDFSSGLSRSKQNRAAFSIGGVYVARARFPVAGPYGAVVQFRYKGTTRTVNSNQFVVAQHTFSPAVGSPAPRSNNPTVAQMPAARLDSGRPPDDMHRLSIAQAITQHKPLLVLFATAGFCTSRMCGPEIQIIEGLEHRYRGRVNFVHIEIYKNANPQYGYAPAVLQWHLHSEPWVFVVDRRGIIVAKFDGPTPASEITPAIQHTLA